MPEQGASPNIVQSTPLSFQHLAVVQVTLSPEAVVKVTAVEQTFTVTGLSLGDTLQAPDQILGISKATEQSGLSVVGARVSAADTIAIKFSNPTAGDITPTAEEAYTFTVFRPFLPALANATTI